MLYHWATGIHHDPHWCFQTESNHRWERGIEAIIAWVHRDDDVVHNLEQEQENACGTIWLPLRLLQTSVCCCMLYAAISPCSPRPVPTGSKQGWAGQYLDGRPLWKTRLLLEEVLVRPAGGVLTLWSVWVLTPRYNDGDTILSKSTDVKPRSWLSVVIKNPMALLVKSGV